MHIKNYIKMKMQLMSNKQHVQIKYGNKTHITKACHELKNKTDQYWSKRMQAAGKS